jgi:hypothetical protein
VVLDFTVDVNAIAAAVRKGLNFASPEQQQKLIQGVVKRITPLSGKEIEIEFEIPVRADAVDDIHQPDGGQYSKQQQSAAGASHRAAA